MGFLLIFSFFDNLFHLFSNRKIQSELWEKHDQHLCVSTSVYTNYDPFKAIKKIHVIFKTLSSDVWHCRKLKIQCHEFPPHHHNLKNPFFDVFNGMELCSSSLLLTYGML